MSDPDVFDYIAIGVGPANLSLAALAERHVGLRGVHLERERRFAWHPGLLLPGATLQVSYLKDLVTPVDPTSPYSFLAFLVATGRFYQFVTARFPAVHRAEFAQYLGWVAEQLPSVRFDHEVLEVDFTGDCFEAVTKHGVLRGRHLVAGTGQQPAIPPAFRDHLGPEVFHASAFLAHEPPPSARRVAVIGGGQSGAEVVRHLLTRPAVPDEVYWVSRRPGLLPLDDSAFTNDLFLPEAAHEFFERGETERAELLGEWKYASDGIDERLLAEIYRANYLATHVAPGRAPLRVFTGHEAVYCESVAPGYRIALRPRGRMSDIEADTVLEADTVILATGYSQRPAPCLDRLLPRLRLRDGLPVVRGDFSADWDGPREHRIYLQNGARHAFGIADPNLSLLAWRSQTILGSIAAEGSPAHVGSSVALDRGRIPLARGRRERHSEYAG